MPTDPAFEDPHLCGDYVKAAAVFARQHGGDGAHVRLELLEAIVHHLHGDLSGDQALLYETYQLLRRVERYGDWDAEYHSDACDLKGRLADRLWPDEQAPDTIDVESREVARPSPELGV